MLYKTFNEGGSVREEPEQEPFCGHHSLRRQLCQSSGISYIHQFRSDVLDPFFQKEQGLPSSTYVNASYVDDLEGVGKVIVTQVNNGKFLLSSHFFWAESKHLKGRLGPP